MSNISSKPRALALATIAGTLILGFGSGAFGTFSTGNLSGHTCGAQIYVAGVGYGYNCIPNAPVSGGGGPTVGPGGPGPSYPIPSATPTPTPVMPLPTISGSITTIRDIDDLPLTQVIATDIGNHRYKAVLETLIARRIMMNNPQVNPNKIITRAEFIKILAKSNRFVPVTSSHKFADLSDSDDLAQYVYFATEKGWINKNNTNFRPNDPISQAEVAKLIAASKGLAQADTVVGPSFSITRGKAASDIFAAFLAQ